MKPRVLVLAFAIGFAPTMHASTASLPTTPTAPAATSSSRQLWAAWGGTVEVRWNRDLAGDVGMRISAPREALPGLSMRGRDRFESAAQRQPRVPCRAAVISAASMAARCRPRGGYTIQLRRWQQPRLLRFPPAPERARSADPRFRRQRRQGWFYIDRLMYELLDHDRTLAVRCDGHAHQRGSWPIASVIPRSPAGRSRTWP